MIRLILLVGARVAVTVWKPEIVSSTPSDKDRLRCFSPWTRTVSTAFESSQQTFSGFNWRCVNFVYFWGG